MPMPATSLPESQPVHAFESDTAATNTPEIPSAAIPQPSVSSPAPTSYSESLSTSIESMPGSDAMTSAMDSETGSPIIIDSITITIEVTLTISSATLFPDTGSESSDSIADQTALPEDEQTASSLQSESFASASQLAYHVAYNATVAPELLLTVTYTTTISLSSN